MADLTVPLPPAADRAAQASPQAYQAACDEAAQILRTRPGWPVLTGRSKRAWRRIGSGFDSQIYNPAHYASYIEAGVPNRSTRNSAARTLARNSRAIIAAAEQASPHSTDRIDALLEIGRFTAASERLEADSLYAEYLLLFQRAGRRNPRRTAAVNRLNRLLRREASNA